MYRTPSMLNMSRCPHGGDSGYQRSFTPSSKALLNNSLRFEVCVTCFWCIYIIYWRWCYEELCCWISVFDCNCCNVGRICSIVATDTKRISETNNKQTLVFLPTTTVIKNNDNQYFIGSYHYYHAANVQSGVEDWAPGRNDMKNWEGQKWSKKKNVCETDTHAHFLK